MDEAYRLKKDHIRKKQRRERRLEIRKKRGGPLFAATMRLACVCLVGYCVFEIVTNQADNAVKRREIEELKIKQEQLIAANEECARLLDDENEQEYYERLAIEALDYAYPSERRFIDTSRS